MSHEARAVVQGIEPRASLLPSYALPSTPPRAHHYPTLRGSYEATESQPPMVLPVEVSLVPDAVASVDEACVALQRLVESCQLLDGQRLHMGSTYTLRAALITHLVLHVLPLPLPLGESAHAARCFWAAPGAVPSAAVQAALLRWLGLASHHYAAVVFSLPPSSALDATRLLVCGAFAAIADAVLRVATPDVASPLSLHYAGSADGPCAGFALEMRHYETETERMLLTDPHLAAARTRLLDYYRAASSVTPSDHLLFRFERSMELGVGERALLGQLCVQLALPRDEARLRAYLSGEDPTILELYPALATLRDVAFLAKAVSHPTADALPETRLWAASDARLIWRVKEDKGGTFSVRAFGGVMQCAAWVDPDDEASMGDVPAGRESTGKTPGGGGGFWQRLVGGKAPRPRRPPSAADASILAGSALATEDDVLQLRHVPDFGGVLRPADSEVLLQALLVPYLRLPLLLQFFAEPTRTSSLSSPELQRMLDAVAFEPAAHEPLAQPCHLPELIPSIERDHLATPCGLLVRELTHAPAQLFASLLTILENALELDVGRYVRGGRSTAVMLYAIALSVRVVKYARFVLSDDAAELRGLERLHTPTGSAEAVRAGISAVRAKLEDHALPVLQGWYKKLRDEDLPHDACTCIAHLAFIVGGYATEGELDERAVFWLLSSRVFINMHLGDLDHLVGDADTLAVNAAAARRNRRPSLADAQRGRSSGQPLGFSAIELMSVWQRHLGSVLRWLAANPNGASTLMEAVAQLEPTPSGGSGLPQRAWTSMVGCGCAGRFVLARSGETGGTSGTSEGVGAPGEAAGRLASMGSPWVVAVPRRGSKAAAAVSPEAAMSLDEKLRSARSSDGATPGSADVSRRPSFANPHAGGGASEYEAWLRGRVCSLEETEINVQLGQLTWKRHHMQLLDKAICEHPDFRAVFGDAAASGRHQCAEVKRSEHRRWLRLLGARHDLHIWSADERAPPAAQSTHRVAIDDDSHLLVDEWVRPALDEFKSLIPGLSDLEDLNLARATADHAMLTGTTALGTRKEVLLVRYPSTCHVFGVVSHGRRWQRVLEYASDTSRSLAELTEMGASLMVSPRPHWQTGNAASDRPPSTSLVITRSITESGGGVSTQRFVPRAHLSGLLPHSLLLQYNVWQRRDGSLLGQRRGGIGAMPPDDAADELEIAIMPNGGATVRRIPLDRRGVRQPHRARWLLCSTLVPQGTALAALLALLERAEDHAHILLWSELHPQHAEMPEDDGEEEGEEEEGEEDGGEEEGDGEEADGADGGGEDEGAKTDADVPSSPSAPSSHPPPRGAMYVGLVEMARLRLSFAVTRDAESGQTTLRCLEHPGMRLGWVESERLDALLVGLPHALLLLNNEGDVHVLLSALCKPCRLTHQDEPLHTQLILARHAPGWASTLWPTARHYLYAVHRSRSYLTPPSLAASLYLLVLRWIARDFESACALAPSCVTDAAFTAEEAALWQLLAEFDADTEPAAHALRLRLHLGSRTCPNLRCPWDPARELVLYLTKLEYMPQACRLAAEDELTLLVEHADSPTLRAHPPAKKRAAFLRGALRADVALAASGGGNLPADDEDDGGDDVPRGLSLDERLALANSRPPPDAAQSPNAAPAASFDFDAPADEKNLLEPEALAGWQRRLANVTYTKPKNESGLGAMKIIDEWLTNASLGSDGKGFGVLYDLLTNALTIRIMIDDSAQVLGALLARLAAPRVAEELVPLLRVLEADAGLAARMPKFKGAAKGFFAKKTNMPEELQAALKELLPQLPQGALRPPRPFAPPADPPTAALSTLRRKHRVWLSTGLLKCDQYMRPVPQLISPLVLEPLQPGQYVHRREPSDEADAAELAARGTPRASRGTDAAAAAIASVERLGIHRHPLAKSLVAKKLLRRLVDDAAYLARSERKGEQLPYVLRDDTGSGDLLAVVSELIRALELVGDADNTTIDAELPALLDFAGGGSASEGTLRARALAQAAGGEPRVSLELLGQLLMSKRGEAELVALFPPLTTAEAGQLLARASTLFLIMSRSAYIARTLTLARRLLESLQTQRAVAESITLMAPTPAPSSALHAGLGGITMPAMMTPTKDPFADSPAPQASLSKSPPPSARLSTARRASRASRSRRKSSLRIGGATVDPRAAETSMVLADQLASMLCCRRAHMIPIHLAKADDAPEGPVNETVAEAVAGVAATVTSQETPSKRPEQKRKSLIDLLHSAISPRPSKDMDDDEGSGANTPDAPASPVITPSAENAEEIDDVAPLPPAPLEPSAAMGAETLCFDPRLLVYEYSTGLVLRTAQVELLGKLVRGARTGRSICHQLLMGEGKTTVISPLLALLLADGSQLVVQIVPSALLAFSLGVLRSSFSIPALRKPVLSFTFDRRTEASEALLRKTRLAVEEHAVIVSTPAAVKAFTLKLLELLHLADTGRQPQNRRRSVASRLKRMLGLKRRSSLSLPKVGVDRAAMLAQATRAAEMLQIWHGAVAVIDEVDVVLHPLKSELNWPLGDRYPLDFAPTRWELPTYLFDAVLAAAAQAPRWDGSVSASGGGGSPFVCTTSAEVALFGQLCEAMALGIERHVIQRQPHPVLLSKDFYFTTLEPILSNLLLTWLRRQGLVDLTDAQALKALEVGPADKQIQHALSDRYVKMLNLGCDWLRHLLPHSLRKVSRVHYGLLSPEEMLQMEAVGGLPRSRRFLAVPFVGKDAPSPSSEFAHPDVAIGLSTLAYRYEGLRPQDFGGVLHHLRTAMENEVGRALKPARKPPALKPARKPPSTHPSHTSLGDSWHFQVGPELKRAASLTWTSWIQSAGRYVRGTRPRASVAVPMGAMPTAATAEPLSVGTPDGVEYGGGLSNEDVLPLHLLDLRDAGYLQLLFALLNRSPLVVRFYLSELVFPEHLAHQHMKLSANGQDLGGDMLFSRRIAFSGTPSSLLPLEMGECVYQVRHTWNQPERPKPMAFHGLPWPSMVFHGLPWPSMA